MSSGSSKGYSRRIVSGVSPAESIARTCSRAIPGNPPPANGSTTSGASLLRARFGHNHVLLRGHAASMSVRAKSPPLNNSGSPAVFASA